MSSPFLVITKPIGPKCNIDCQYCFYLRKEGLFDNPSYVMDDQTLENWVESYIESQKNSPEIHFIWQGGEPTLCGLDFFKKILKLQQKYQPKTTLITNAIQTNGILITDEWAEFLKQHNFLVGISIDGPQGLHDRYRVDRSKKGTYKLVVQGLNRLLEHQVDVNALTVVNALNSQYPKQVYNHLVGLGFEHIQFIPCVEPIFSQSNKVLRTAAWSVCSKNWGDFLNGVFNEWYNQNHMKQIHVQLFDIQLNIQHNIPPSLCIFSPRCGQGLALEHTGDLYACDHFVEEEWKLGNINQESLVSLAKSPKQQMFGDLKYTTLPRNCKICPWLQRCWGDCPKNRFIPDKKNPPKAYLCKGWKKFFKYTDPYFKELASIRSVSKNY